MMVHKGQAVCGGIVIGKIAVFNPQKEFVEEKKCSDIEKEIERVKIAISMGKVQLHELYEKALEEVDKDSATIFEAHEMIMEDEDYLAAIYDLIKQKHVNAEYAVSQVGSRLYEEFVHMGNEYLRERALDMKDVSNRLINILEGHQNNFSLGEEPMILVAEDLEPSQTMSLDRSKILAFVTSRGSVNSHTAILSRGMGIPALINVEMDLDKVKTANYGIVDAEAGVFITDPTLVERERAEKKVLEEKKKRESLRSLIGMENVTKGGKHIHIYANVGNLEDCQVAIDNDAGGIGLFRSEFLYLGRKSLPTEDEQFDIYKSAAEMMKEKPVIIRTFDIGADKQVDYLQLGKEANPAMGYRAIRICLDQLELFKDQLRALLRAAVYGNIEIMYPMITSVEEILKIKQIFQDVIEEFQKEGKEYSVPKQGIMIETPAAALISDELAQHVDFFSIGTNDLTQYTLAVDRQNSKVSTFYNPYHKAILRMIRLVVNNAHKAGIWVGVCGELGGDKKLLSEFIAMGLDEISVAPNLVLGLRKSVREIEL